MSEKILLPDLNITSDESLPKFILEFQVENFSQDLKLSSLKGNVQSPPEIKPFGRFKYKIENTIDEKIIVIIKL